MKVLCLHGVSTDENELPPPYWLAQWKDEIGRHLSGLGPAVDFVDYAYNHLFNAVHADIDTYLSAIWQGIHSAASNRGLAARGEQDVDPGSVSMVAKWLAVDGLREQLRQGLAQVIREQNPDLIVAHSLGSLILYDTLIEDDSLCRGRVLITCGSQIGHPFVREAFGQYVRVPQGFAHWFHLYNWQDLVLAFDPLPFTAEALTTVETPFLYHFINHDAVHYLAHERAAAECWAALSVVAARALGGRGGGLVVKPVRKVPVRRASQQRRALLVGINNYPQPENRLGGCVNDVFSMSAVLQECGYDPDSIRVVLDERATTQAVLERLHWLLDDVRPGEERLFFYSGHGTRLMQYNADGEPDHHDEALVTWDFDWKDNCGITDDMLAGLYANLPYDAHAYFVLDCCHSGGMVRAGRPAVRGIDPPDDVRHRAIRWDPSSDLWVARELTLRRKLKPQDRRAQGPQALVPGALYLGRDLATHRLGRAVGLWSEDPDRATAECRRMGHKGPYNPVIVASCGEGESAYEYRHGVESHGAFTFVLTDMLLRRDKPLALERLVSEASGLLRDRLQLSQHPHVYNPAAAANPFALAGGKTKEKGGEDRPKKGGTAGRAGKGKGR